ncbi:peptide/nickel transport system permease protein [Thermoactinomyces sp. DSM 45891]|uniref:oligopeptide ABC transporter permease n=1 Tax=unclassified Thermoactinomyces TaxID=2634588 RepID=UPI000896FA91|nr:MULTISPECIES: oligopeptide ABC transporter permease [unclassified Thermoactinomyces]SDZ36899.1 peptide/nickel transport system permease protein [Thermoactinomyces sp. DSM 45892]SFX42423.1 peptide/nickel transport system permease protein [Thermoactinomyces sp. DSM 45891]
MKVSVELGNRKNLKEEKHASPFKLGFQRFLQNKMAFVGLIVLSIIVLLTVASPWLTTHNPELTDLTSQDLPPSGEHFLGTDSMGYDIYSRLVTGGRVSLVVGFCTMFFTVVIGITFGSIAGYFGGKVDSLMMRFTDLMLNFPFLVFVLFLISIFEKTTVPLLITALALTSWPTTTRLVRGIFLSLREMEYVQSAKAIGNKNFRIIFRHMMPNAIAPIIVNATLLMAQMISIEAALSFLGFGIPDPTPAWGGMLNDGMDYTIMTERPWQWIPAGVLIVLTVLSINFIGDGLRDAFDTKSTRR